MGNDSIARGIEMLRKHRSYVTIFLALLTVLAGITGCSNPEENKQKAYERGLALLESGETRSAILEFRNAIQIDPQFMEARYQLGICLLEIGNHAAALGELERVQKADPDHAALRSYLAEALVGTGKFAEAKTLYEDLLLEDPANARYHDFLSLALLGLGQAQLGKPADESGMDAMAYFNAAKAEAQKAIDIDPVPGPGAGPVRR